MIPFTKAHGNGNDFVIFEAADCPPVIREAAFIQRVCHRQAGVGADGVLILSRTAGNDATFKIDYYNADGSWETFCANGSRCAIQYWARADRGPAEMTIETGAGLHYGRRLADGQVELQILAPKQASAMLTVAGRKGQLVDTGAPHFAVEVDVLDRDMLAAEGPVIRYADAFKPRGANVNFFRRQDEQTIQVMTYEKGVEAVVMSCASGSTAACFHAAMTGPLKSPVRIINPGGELQVKFDAGWQDVTVSGPAVLVFDAQLPDDF